MQPNLIPAVLVVSAIFLLSAIATLIIKKKHNNKYFYRFFTDRLEYRNTFFSKEIKKVQYSDFKEIRYNQGYMQSKFNVGELWLLTNSKNFFKKVLIFKSIPNIEKEYERIVKLFDTQGE